MPILKLKIKKRVDRSYKIFIQEGAVKLLPSFLKKEKLGKKYAIITDTTIKKLFANKLQALLKRNGIKSEIFSFAPGEKSKSMPVVEKLSEEMVAKGFDRHDAVLAIGGGVTGDMAGFLASIYMRGIPFIHIPTSLMAMVDSAIGGKTGVDLKSGKNLLGSITQPAAVFVDLDYLKNLPDKQIKNGLAEVIKYGVIWDKSLFKFLEQNPEKVLGKDVKALEKIVKKSIRIKCKIVQEDEKETGRRIILNYGHTYGHALEKLSNYTLLHGYAISIGMVLANKIAVAQKILKEKDAVRIKELLKAYGLPVVTTKKVTKQDIACDKKRVGNYVQMILPTKIGRTIIYKQKCV